VKKAQRSREKFFLAPSLGDFFVPALSRERRYPHNLVVSALKPSSSYLTTSTMTLSDSDSDDSSCGSFADDPVPAKTAANKRTTSVSTTTTYQDSDSTIDYNDISSGSDSDDSSDDEGPRRRGGKRSGVDRTKSMSPDPPKSRRAPARNKSFEGDEHMRMRKLMGEFDKATSYKTKKEAKKDREKQQLALGKNYVGTEETERSVRLVRETSVRFKNAMDDSAHSLAKMNEQLEKDAALLSSGDDEDDELAMKKVEDFSFADMKKGSKVTTTESSAVKQAQLARQVRELKRQERLQRAMERIEREKEEKLDKERKEKLRALEVNDSEDARRDRIYSWYLRMAMPNKETFEDKVALLPYTAKVTVEDIALLKWNKRETRAFKVAEL